MTAPAQTRSPRTLGVACGGLAVAAGLLWGASAVEWLPGRTGAQIAPSLTGVALLALAGVAGVLATGGALRRLVGLLLTMSGIGQVVGALLVGLGLGGGPLLAAAGGLVLLAAGALVVVREPALPRLGARYAAPGDRRAPRDPDRAAWDALDEGRDPRIPRQTADPSRRAGLTPRPERAWLA
ncbi:hypothetical protein BJF78_07520 [Pseudonocardia sp. CNS-139]|nr:hypothetical protein BJF78_07520 [Pseudonocardia sp. CNS-139]